MLTACGGSGVFVEAPTASFATTDVPRPPENVFVANLLPDDNEVFIHTHYITEAVRKFCLVLLCVHISRHSESGSRNVHIYIGKVR